MNFILGICGHPGSGKSEVLKILQGKGWYVIDADEVVHRLYEKGRPGQRKVVDFFGDEFISKDGSVNRSKLRKVVFSDFKKLKILNVLIHPLVFNEISKELYKLDEEKVAIEAVYFEDKYLNKLVDKILVVERPDVNTKEFIDILPKKVDGKVLNNSTLKDLEKQVIIQVEKLTS
ncbi:dephospho-CoA kinase [Candidatus Peregrinibacteria bacterium]|jgi:dephospho-CoA kinase|nr:dephospho-CoA kinase [Candidatus Peregrinibacteria bacterium]MBT4148327.1 dephospho-CoA kinase [Candidatus Peregrinibacteria bacterium]MBT4366392.1 dephospho-CoA kinase [Candidatus Peregrinibacteria bacterium]MBT4455920.1 dephospho-CoA kinase [Candidatus Peregrinibacteria bacterium]